MTTWMIQRSSVKVCRSENDRTSADCVADILIHERDFQIADLVVRDSPLFDEFQGAGA